MLGFHQSPGLLFIGAVLQRKEIGIGAWLFLWGNWLILAFITVVQFYYFVHIFLIALIIVAELALVVEFLLELPIEHIGIPFVLLLLQLGLYLLPGEAILELVDQCLQVHVLLVELLLGGVGRMVAVVGAPLCLARGLGVGAAGVHDVGVRRQGDVEL